jgi:hypothetical protein
MIKTDGVAPTAVYSKYRNEDQLDRMDRLEGLLFGSIKAMECDVGS